MHYATSWINQIDSDSFVMMHLWITFRFIRIIKQKEKKIPKKHNQQSIPFPNYCNRWFQRCWPWTWSGCIFPLNIIRSVHWITHFDRIDGSSSVVQSSNSQECFTQRMKVKVIRNSKKLLNMDHDNWIILHKSREKKAFFRYEEAPIMCIAKYWINCFT